MFSSRLQTVDKYSTLHNALDANLFLSFEPMACLCGIWIEELSSAMEGERALSFLSVATTAADTSSETASTRTTEGESTSISVYSSWILSGTSESVTMLRVLEGDCDPSLWAPEGELDTLSWALEGDSEICTEPSLDKE